MDIGNLNSRLQLVCHTCSWIPPSDTTMGLVDAHFRTEHATGEVTLELRPVCPCGAPMSVTVTPDDGRVHYKHHAICARCGNTGYVKQGDG